MRKDESKEQEMAASPAPTRLPVLVIEDEAPVMAFLCSALQRSGYHTVQANSGAEGIKLLEQGSFMGIISDMRTPGGINGADVHAWIRKNRPAMSRRMLFITGDTVNPETTDRKSVV